MDNKQIIESPKSSPPGSRIARKQVTVLFCDIADYTERSACMDPEDLAKDIHEFQTICTRIADACDGHISNYLGDGVMVLFGHPLASEFSPERAARAGLKMVEAIKHNNQQPQWQNKKPLAIRIGIATGLVVVGERAGKHRDQDQLVFGTAPNLAARLQSIAAPNTVVTALRTRRLVGLAFKFKDLGIHNLKGFNQPVNAWQILHERKMQKRPGNALKRSTSRFISRQRELSLLQKAYESAGFGFSRFVHIVGEPGIGKTRVIRRFERTIANHQIHRMRVNCSPYYQNSFLKPVSDECFRWLRIAENDDLETRQASVSWAMSVVNLCPRDQHILFTEFLDIPPPSPLPDLEMSPEEKRQRIIQVLAQIIIEISSNQLLLLVVEDLHWADQSTLALLKVLIEQSSQDQLLGVFTARPPLVADWGRAQSLNTLYMHGLTRTESKLLVESIFQDRPLPESLKQNLIKKSDGVPLYLEESCVSAIDHLDKTSDLTALQNFTVPETLQDSLNARLDQLGDAHALAQLASAFGQNFTYLALSNIASSNNIDADVGMDILIDQNIVVIEEGGVEDHFRFRHAMFQEAAYQSLLIKTRRHYHKQIAALFRASDHELVDKRPELIAYHLSRTDDIEQAIDLWIKAGRLAIEKSAIAESIDHIHRGLQLIKNIKPGAVRQRKELALLLNLGVAITARDGYHGFEVARTYRDAATLAKQVGNAADEWTALYGLWRCLISQAEFGAATKMSVRLGSLSKILDAPILRLTTTGIKAMTRMVDGKLNKSVALYDTAVALYDSAVDKQVGLKFGQDPFVTIQGLSAVNKLITGDAAASIKGIERSIAVARAIGHPYTIAETLKVAAMYEQISLNMERLRGHCIEALAISDQYGFEGVHATHSIFLAFTDVVQHDDSSRIDIIKHNLLLYENKYGLLFLPYFQSLLAESCLLVGQFQAAFDNADATIKSATQRGEKWVIAMLYYIKSEAALRGDLASPDDIAHCYKLAVDTAATQGAQLFLGRILNRRHAIAADTETAIRYERLANPHGAALSLSNIDYITRLH